MPDSTIGFPPELEASAREFAFLHGQNSVFPRSNAEGLLHISLAIVALCVIAVFWGALTAQLSIAFGLGLSGAFYFGALKSEVEATNNKMAEISSNLREKGWRIDGSIDGAKISVLQLR